MRSILVPAALLMLLSTACGSEVPAEPLLGDGTAGRADTAVGAAAAASSTGEIVIAYDGSCLDVTGVSSAQGAKIHEWSCNGAANQTFKFVPFSDGTVAIEPSNDNLCLDAGNIAGIAATTAVPLTQEKCNGGTAQHWRLSKSGANHTISTPDGTRCIDVYNTGKGNGTPVNTYACHNGSNQQFHLPAVATSNQSAGCGKSGARTGTFDLTTTDGKKATRTFEVMVPAGYKSSISYPLVLAYHGAAGTEADAVKYDIQNGSGASSGAIFLFPRGVKQNGVVGWDDSCGGADIPFDKNMLSTIEDEYCIDTSRVFAAGFSWGCDHVTAMHCCLGDQVRAISGASCTDEFSKPTDHTTYENKCVANSRPAGIRFTHDASGGDGAYAKPLFTTTSQLYRSWNACSNTEKPVTLSSCTSYKPGCTCDQWTGCSSELLECQYAGLGHRTPPNWGPDTWDFFNAFK